MLFMQPVAVNEAGNGAAAAEVRMAEPRAAAPGTWTDWTGTRLAQSSLDQRSPFGANAVDNNNRVTPGAATTPPVPPSPASDNPDVDEGKAPAGPSSTSAPEPGRPDASPPVGGGGTTTAPPAAAPGTATPSSTPGGAAGIGNASGTMSAPNNSITPPGNIDQPRSSTPPGTTLPGGSSGASNSR